MPRSPAATPVAKPLRRASKALLLALPLLASGETAFAEKRRAFATSTSWTGDILNWPGATGATVLDRADSVCRALAAAADPPMVSRRIILGRNPCFSAAAFALAMVCSPLFRRSETRSTVA